jgi:molybdenum cofactor biosynthesis enzyme MoaA
MLLMKSEAACGRCPLNLLCMTLRPLPDVMFCRRCGAITFKRDGERYLCMLIRDGVNSRLKDTMWQQQALMSDHDKRIAHVIAAVVNKHAEYTGCTQMRKRHTKRHKQQFRWVDCVHYFLKNGNGFDREF